MKHTIVKLSFHYLNHLYKLSIPANQVIVNVRTLYKCYLSYNMIMFFNFVKENEIIINYR
jgi:hypothetical protein